MIFNLPFNSLDLLLVEDSYKALSVQPFLDQDRQNILS